MISPKASSGPPDPAWPLGQYYQVRGDSQGEGGSYPHFLSIDSFAAVPEPASVTLLVLGGLMLLERRWPGI